MKKTSNITVENMKGTDYLEDSSVDDRIILKCNNIASKEGNWIPFSYYSVWIRKHIPLNAVLAQSASLNDFVLMLVYNGSTE